jgi:hypothetical protein
MGLAETQEVKSECPTWGPSDPMKTGPYQHVQGTWELKMVVIPGATPGTDREEWYNALSRCIYDNELVNGEIPPALRPQNGGVVSCKAAVKWVEEPKGSGMWVQKWFYPSLAPFCSHDPYGGWMLCGGNCIYPAEFYGAPSVPPMTTVTKPGP